MPICYFTRMTENDLENVLKIDERSFEIPWTYPLFMDELNYKHSVNLTVRSYDVIHDSVVSFICFQLILDEMHILRFAVDPDCRGRGIGRWVLKRSMEKAKDGGAKAAFLEVRSTNDSALALYRKAGFTAIGVRKGYYGETGGDALILKKLLS